MAASAVEEGEVGNACHMHRAALMMQHKQGLQMYHEQRNVPVAFFSRA
jgi:hypothetical protein